YLRCVNLRVTHYFFLLAFSRLITTLASPAVKPVFILHIGHSIADCMPGHKQRKTGLFLLRLRNNFFAGSEAGLVCQSLSLSNSFIRSGLHLEITSSALENASCKQL